MTLQIAAMSVDELVNANVHIHDSRQLGRCKVSRHPVLQRMAQSGQFAHPAAIHTLIWPLDFHPLSC
jgi:hypothetical protein